MPGKRLKKSRKKRRGIRGFTTQSSSALEVQVTKKTDFTITMERSTSAMTLSSNPLLMLLGSAKGRGFSRKRGTL